MAVKEERKNNMEKFNPNIKHKDIHGTYIPSRSPKFKIHESLAIARSALLCKSFYDPSSHKYKIIDKENLLFKYEGDKWIELDFTRRYEKGKKLEVFSKID